MKLRKWREVWRPIISRAIRCGLLRAPDGVLVASQPPQTHPGGVPNFSDGCARVLPAWAFLVASGTRLWIDHVLRRRQSPRRRRPCCASGIVRNSSRWIRSRSVACRKPINGSRRRRRSVGSASARGPAAACRLHPAPSSPSRESRAMGASATASSIITAWRSILGSAAPPYPGTLSASLIVSIIRKSGT